MRVITRVQLGIPTVPLSSSRGTKSDSILQINLALVYSGHIQLVIFQRLVNVGDVCLFFVALMLKHKTEPRDDKGKAMAEKSIVLQQCHKYVQEGLLEASITLPLDCQIPGAGDADADSAMPKSLIVQESFSTQSFFSPRIHILPFCMFSTTYF